MSRFNVCIIVPKNSSNSDELAQQAFDTLAKFDLNKEMPPYKHYIKPDVVKSMAGHFKTDDLSELAAKMESWDGDTGGVDEGGLYGISTKNPDAWIDEWEILTEIKPEDRPQLLFGEGEEKICRAIVTPDGKWINGPYIFGSPNAEQEKELAAWLKQFNEVLDQNKDAALFLAECHS
jgi:hypothetical protein